MITKRFAVIAEQVSALDNVILDGELCALDEHGHPRFEWLVNRGRQRGKLATLSTKETLAETPAKKRHATVRGPHRKRRLRP